LSRLRGGGALVALVALGLFGCDEGRQPPYLRLSGPAQVLPAWPKEQALLVAFWASWCAPCVRETPQLRALAEDPPPGLAVVVLSHDEELADVHKVFGGPPPQQLHLALDADRAVGRAYGVAVLPESYLVVRGQKVARFRGPQDWSSPSMRRLLKKLVAAPAL
jgi:cytochrome c biogenesis protein CcmG, thiol:disulfide interchange protein DsbE